LREASIELHDVPVLEEADTANQDDDDDEDDSEDLDDVERED
jgi:hypothetical protein